MNKVRTHYTREKLSAGTQGTCPYCLRTVKARKHGEIYRHGWTESGRGSGYVIQTGPYCLGSGKRPLEETDADAREFIIDLALEISRIKKRADALEDGTTTKLMITTKTAEPWHYPGKAPEKIAECFGRALRVIADVEAGKMAHNGLKLRRRSTETERRYMRERTVHNLVWEISQGFTALAPASAEVIRLPSWRDLKSKQLREWLERVKQIAEQIAQLGDACETEQLKQTG